MKPEKKKFEKNIIQLVDKITEMSVDKLIDPGINKSVDKVSFSEFEREVFQFLSRTHSKLMTAIRAVAGDDQAQERQALLNKLDDLVEKISTSDKLQAEEIESLIDEALQENQ